MTFATLEAYRKFHGLQLLDLSRGNSFFHITVSSGASISSNGQPNAHQMLAPNLSENSILEHIFSGNFDKDMIFHKAY
jgi:hypothetical protein